MHRSMTFNFCSVQRRQTVHVHYRRGRHESLLSETFLSSTCRQSSLALPQRKSEGNNFKIFRPPDVLLSAKEYLIFLQKVTSIDHPFLFCHEEGSGWGMIGGKLGGLCKGLYSSLPWLMEVCQLRKAQLREGLFPLFTFYILPTKSFCKSLTGAQILNLLYLAQMLTLWSA